MYLENPLRICT